jgi:hypothetical protein
MILLAATAAATATRIIIINKNKRRPTPASPDGLRLGYNSSSSSSSSPQLVPESGLRHTEMDPQGELRTRLRNCLKPLRNLPSGKQRFAIQVQTICELQWRFNVTCTDMGATVASVAAGPLVFLKYEVNCIGKMNMFDVESRWNPLKTYSQISQKAPMRQFCLQNPLFFNDSSMTISRPTKSSQCFIGLGFMISCDVICAETFIFTMFLECFRLRAFDANRLCPNISTFRIHKIMLFHVFKHHFRK